MAVASATVAGDAWSLIDSSSTRLHFTCVRLKDERETLIARGEMEIACLRGTTAAPVPEELKEALRPYQAA